MRIVNPVNELHRFVSMHPHQKDAAKVLEISNSYLTDLLKERRRVTDELLMKLGCRRIVVKGADQA